ncbi:MAG: ATP-binding protein, partial [Candidatus Competibacter sp.]|nr:ATP-binding protein [Candidatus Competibacter sp.]
MDFHYIHRTLEPVLQRAMREFPAIVLTGPRQSGKTTLLKSLFGASHGYVSLEPPDVRAAASSDPRGFLALYPPPVIFDEVQYAPDLLPYLKEWIDAHRDRRGQYLLTGSQNPLLLEQVTESLAGRAAILRLLPLSWRESLGQPDTPLPWEREDERPPRPELSYPALWQGLLRGGYPELVVEPGRDQVLWHGSYLQTYLERDVRSLRQIGDLTLFQNFLRALATRSGQLLNLTDLARDLGATVNTIKAWLSVLEATFQVIVLRPYFANVGKRLVKTPKVYFTDTGTLCYLAGLRDPEHAAAGPLGGAIIETAVLAEIVKTFWHRGEEPQVYFWRTATGVEVDVVVEVGGRIVPVEIKLSATPRPAMAAGILALRQDLGEKVEPGYVIHPGEIQLPLAPGVRALPFIEWLNMDSSQFGALCDQQC